MYLVFILDKEEWLNLMGVGDMNKKTRHNIAIAANILLILHIIATWLPKTIYGLYTLTIQLINLWK